MASEPGNGAVQIFLDGLIVSRLDGDRKFELGVLNPSHSGHRFTICYEITTADGEVTPHHVTLSATGLLVLGIEDVSEHVEAFESDTQPRRLRRPGGSGTARHKDFRWILDLESADDFPQHPSPLRLTGPFQQIIHIKNGTIYTSSLMTKPLRRFLVKDGTRVDFGVSSDMIGIDLNVTPGQDVVMRYEGVDNPVFRIHLESRESAEIFIFNLPPDPRPGSDPVSHFHEYYNVFEVPSDRRYDFVIPRHEALGEPDPNSHADSGKGANTEGMNRYEKQKTEHAATAETSERAVPRCGGGSGHPGMLCGIVRSNQPIG